MATPRTTIAAVKLVISTSLDDPDIDQFINDAALWVTQNLGSAGLDDAVLEAIERYLACHYLSQKDPRLKSLTIQDQGVEVYQRDLYVTEYLKTAASWDTTGTVKTAFLTEKSVSFRVGADFNDDLSLPVSS